MILLQTFLIYLITNFIFYLPNFLICQKLIENKLYLFDEKMHYFLLDNKETLPKESGKWMRHRLETHNIFKSSIYLLKLILKIIFCTAIDPTF